MFLVQLDSLIKQIYQVPAKFLKINIKSNFDCYCKLLYELKINVIEEIKNSNY